MKRKTCENETKNRNNDETLTNKCEKTWAKKEKKFLGQKRHFFQPNQFWHENLEYLAL